MEVVTESDAPRQGGDLIRLICKRNQELFVTRSLLIRSSTYFAAMLSKESGWEENSSKAIELVSWSRNDLATILRSLKTKKTGPIFGDLNRFFTAINYFSITPLMEQCIEFKLNNVSDENVIDDLEFAERFAISALKDKCMELLLGRLPDVLRNSRRSRRRMSAELLHTLLRHEKLSVRNEDEVLSAIDDWCSPGKRQSERGKLLQEVRFAHLTEEAFERCRQDAQCRELPQFRVLLDTARWSDLGEKLLSGRKFTRVHYHAVGFLTTRIREHLLEFSQFADGLLVYCSETGGLSTARDHISEAYGKSMVYNECPPHVSVMYGNGLFVFQRTEELYCVRSKAFSIMETITELKYFSDYRDSAPSLTVRFPSVVYAAAPPVVFENDVFILHMRYRSEPVFDGSSFKVDIEHFDDLELTRYHNGTATSRKLSVPVESASRYNFRRDLLLRAANTLLVNDEWTILLVPNQGSLIVFDSPHPVGPVIDIPEKSWNLEEPLIDRTRTFSDLVIVGNVAYVVLIFYMMEKVWHQYDRRWCVRGENQRASITAYDLTEGKWLPEHFLDLETLFTEIRRQFKSYIQRFEISLKVVDNEVFVFLATGSVFPNDAPLPLTSPSYVYRLERSAEGLRMSPASESAFLSGSRRYEKKEYYNWHGHPVPVDTCPCKYATKLQAKASREQDAIEREKLRRFIW